MTDIPEKEMVYYTESNGKSLYKLGYRKVMNKQYGPSYCVGNAEKKAPWGHGLYELQADGSLRCISFNYDSSG